MWSPNPYALAQLLLPDGRARDYGKEWEAAKSLLEDAFHLKMEMVFFPEHDGPPGLQVFRDFAQQFRRPRTLGAIMDAIKKQPMGRAAITRFTSETIEKVLPFLVPVKGTNFRRPGAHELEPGEVGIYKPLGAFQNSEAAYLQPQQGMVADCYLISSMISLAWTAPAQWRQFLNDASSNVTESDNYGFRFTKDDGRRGQPFEVKPWVPVDGSDRPYFARSLNSDVAWPALVEKAFVMQRHRRAHEDPVPADYQFIGDPLHRWYPMDACHALIGGSSQCIPNTADAPHSLAKVVREKCCIAPSKVTSYPTMASTFPETVQAMADRHLAWGSIGLVYGHAYAVLGLMTQRGKQFVVLRDPHGVSNPKILEYAQGTWVMGPGINGVESVALNKGGVFALPAEWFDACFFRVDWVVPKPPAHR